MTTSYAQGCSEIVSCALKVCSVLSCRAFRRRMVLCLDAMANMVPISAASVSILIAKAAGLLDSHALEDG